VKLLAKLPSPPPINPVPENAGVPMKFSTLTAVL
jgi:hypothetical protein